MFFTPKWLLVLVALAAIAAPGGMPSTAWAQVATRANCQATHGNARDDTKPQAGSLAARSAAHGAEFKNNVGITHSWKAGPHSLALRRQHGVMKHARMAAAAIVAHLTGQPVNATPVVMNT